MEKTPQLLVTGWVVRGINCPVVLAEELLALLFGEEALDHQRIGGVFHRLRGHATQLTLACPPHRPGRGRRRTGFQAIRPECTSSAAGTSVPLQSAV